MGFATFKHGIPAYEINDFIAGMKEEIIAAAAPSHNITASAKNKEIAGLSL